MTKLAYQLEDISQLPEQVAGFYTKTDTGYRLNVDVPEDNKVKEFREKNIDLMKQVAKFQTLTTVLGEDGLDANKLQDRLDALATSKAQEALKNKDTELAAEREQRVQLQGTVENLLISDQVSRLALQHGVLEAAMPDVLNRAKSTFIVKDGKVAVRDGALGADGKPMTMETWFTSLSETAQHFFSPSQGAGAKKPQGSGAPASLSALEKISAGVARLRK